MPVFLVDAFRWESPSVLFLAMRSSHTVAIEDVERVDYHLAEISVARNLRCPVCQESRILCRRSGLPEHLHPHRSWFFTCPASSPVTDNIVNIMVKFDTAIDNGLGCRE